MATQRGGGALLLAARRQRWACVRIRALCWGAALVFMAERRAQCADTPRADVGAHDPRRAETRAQAECCAACCDQCIDTGVRTGGAALPRLSPPVPTADDRGDACRAPLLQLASHSDAGGLWFAAPRTAGQQQGEMRIVREGADASGTVLVVRIEPDAESAQRARLWLNGVEVGTCPELPCDVTLPPVGVGAHSIAVAVSCGGAEATEHLRFELHPRRPLAAPQHGGDGTAYSPTCGGLGESCAPDSARQRRRATAWRALADEHSELWDQIRQQDALDYVARRRISPHEIAAPASCPAQSVCGVWAVPTAAAGGGEREAVEAAEAEVSEDTYPACVDLCVGRAFLPPAGALVRSREEAEDAAAFQQMLFDLQFPSPSPSPPSGGGGGGSAPSEQNSGGGEDSGGGDDGGGGGGHDGGADAAEAFISSAEAVLLRPAASPLSGFGVTIVYAVHNLAKAASAARIWYVCVCVCVCVCARARLREIRSPLATW